MTHRSVLTKLLLIALAGAATVNCAFLAAMPQAYARLVGRPDVKVALKTRVLCAIMATFSLIWLKIAISLL